MADTSSGTLFLKAADFVDVIDEAGNKVGTAPKHWRADQLPAGTKLKAGKAGKAGKDDEGPKVPAKSSSRADLNAYAVEHGGLSAEEAEAFKSAEELHAALVERAQAPTA